MRKSLLTVGFLVLLAFAGQSVMAQDVIPFGFGVKAGLSMGKFKGDDAASHDWSQKYQMGAGFGGYIEYNMAPMIAVQLEALYVALGGKFERDSEFETFKINYLHVPLLLKISPPISPGMKPHFFAGPTLGIRMSSKVNYDYGSGEEEEDLKDYTKSTDFGLTFGAGLGFKLTKLNAFIEGRYYLGLSKVFDIEDGDLVDAKNSGLMFMAGVGF